MLCKSFSVFKTCGDSFQYRKKIRLGLTMFGVCNKVMDWVAAKLHKYITRDVNKSIKYHDYLTYIIFII